MLWWLQMLLGQLTKRARLVLDASVPEPFKNGKSQEVRIRIGIIRCCRASSSKSMKEGMAWINRCSRASSGISMRDNMASKWHSAKQEAQEVKTRGSKSASASSAHLPAAIMAQRGWTAAALAFSAAAST